MGAAEGSLGGPSPVSSSLSPSPLLASDPSRRGLSHGIPGPAAFLETIRGRGAHTGLYGLFGTLQGLFLPWGLLRDEGSVFSPAPENLLDQ